MWDRGISALGKVDREGEYQMRGRCKIILQFDKNIFVLGRVSIGWTGLILEQERVQGDDN